MQMEVNVEGRQIAALLFAKAPIEQRGSHGKWDNRPAKAIAPPLQQSRG